MSPQPPLMFARPPVPALAPVVESLWACRQPDLPHRRERHLPSAAVQILVNLDRDGLVWSDGPRLERGHTLGGAAINGPFDRPIGLHTRDQRRIVGAVLRPGRAAAVLGLPIVEVAGTHVDLDHLAGFRGLRQRLLEAPPGRVLATFEAWLLTRLQLAQVDRAVVFACAALSEGAAVAAVAERLGMSSRTLRRRFNPAVGLGPKRFGRLARFQRAARRIAAGAVDDWAGFALDAGYFDQAHFNREFRAFSGLTPTAFRPLSAGGHNHVAL